MRIDRDLARAPERIQPSMFGRATRLLAALTTTCTVAVGVLVALAPSAAMASPQLSIPADNPLNNQTVPVSGSGFPPHRQDPTGIQMLECSDPGGSEANLPRDATRCDGSTVNFKQINTDANGNFADKFTFVKLNSTHSSNIDCDATHFCVLWAGVDYNTDFLGQHAFSRAFEIGGTGGAVSSTPVLVIVLPVVAVAIGAALVVIRRRGRGSGPRATTTASEPAPRKLRVRA